MKEYKYKGVTFIRNKDWKWELWHEGRIIGLLHHGRCQYEYDKKRIVNVLLEEPFPKKLEALGWNARRSAAYDVINMEDPCPWVQVLIRRLEDDYYYGK